MDETIDLAKITKGKIAVFIDAANILYSQRTLGWKIDYQKLKSFIEAKTEIYGVFYYTGKVGTLEKQEKFFKKLKKIGFTVVSKEVKFIKINKNKVIPKGNLDIELALDAFRLNGEYDTLLLFSGDSDFAYLLDLLKEQKKRVIVVSTRGHVSIELLERAKFIDLRKLKNLINLDK